MTSYIKAVQFLAGARKKHTLRFHQTAHTLRLSAKTVLDFDIYTPVKQKSPVPVIFLHGMSPMGYRDPRQIKICAILASLGYLVYAPSVEGIKNLTLSADHIQIFISFCQHLDKNSQFSSEAGYAFFAPSFSGAICLQAAAHAELSTRIKAICLIGTFSDFTRCSDYLLFEKTADQYARWLILANFLPGLKIISEKILKAFRGVILQFWTDSTGYQIPKPAVKLNANEKKILEQLMYDQNFIQKNYKGLFKKMQPAIKAYDVHSYLSGIQAHILVLHGSTDNVIPASESENLYTLLQIRGIKSRLVISPFLNHANPELDFSLLRQVWRLVAGLAFFFRHVR